MVNTSSATSINDQAAEWAVIAAFGDMSPEEEALLQVWLAADRRHQGAYIRACAWLRASETAIVSDAAPRPLALVARNDNDRGEEKTGRDWRGGMLRWAGRVAAGGLAVALPAAVMLMLGATPPWMQPEISTAAPRIMQLRDGSIATLDGNARIQVVMSDDIRNITLLNGSARFEVAKDPARPFVVRSGDIYAQATGTVYTVTRLGHTGGTVDVSEGRVLVWPRDERDQAVLVRAGGRVTLDPGPREMAPPSHPHTAPVRLPPPELAQISLDNVPVRIAVARFNRVNSRKIRVSDPAISEITIIGLYRANDPESFAQSVATLSDGYVEMHGHEIVIKPK